MTLPDSAGLEILANVLPAGNLAGDGFPFAGIAAVVSLMLAEYLYGRLAGHDTHDLSETASSLTIGLGYKIIGVITAGALAIPMIFLHGHALFDLPMGAWWTWPLLFVAIEFCYYWHHYAMHKVRWLWASHAVHHSATRLNFTAGIRLGWGGGLTGGLLFYLPLPLIGFEPLTVGIMLSANLGYQFFLHPAVAPNLGPLEWVLNTPRHHHVHQPQQWLLNTFHGSSKKDQAGACSPDGGARLSQLSKRLHQAVGHGQLAHGSALSAGDDQAAEVLQILG